VTFPDLGRRPRPRPPAHVPRTDPGVGQRRAARRQPADIVLSDRDQVVPVHGGDVEVHRSFAFSPSAITASMAQRTRPPFRADHVGSLLRPDRLRDARAAFKAGQRPRRNSGRWRMTRSARVIELQRDSGLQTSPTASCAAPPGTWTSSTRFGGSPRSRGVAARAVPQRGGRRTTTRRRR
jgi:hypothetical protein